MGEVAVGLQLPDHMVEFYVNGFNRRTKQITAILDMLGRQDPELYRIALTLFDKYEAEVKPKPAYEVKYEGEM
jgi:hypothetical protein